MSKNNRIPLMKRLSVWSELLARPEGVSYRQMENKLVGESEATVTLSDTLRQDVVLIKELIEHTDVEFIPFKKGGISYFKLSSQTDLVTLHIQRKAGRPNAEILNLIARTQGIFPQEFLSEISSTYKEIIEQQDRKEFVISFEQNNVSAESMKYFPKIYRAINNKGLLITRHKANSPDNREQVVFYPEFLKQYNSEWHAYGVVISQNGVDEKKQYDRIPLSLVDYIESTPIAGGFISSGTDYFEFFDEIVGVEMDMNCNLEDICMYVSYELYPVIKRNPIHSSQRDDKKAERKSGYKAIRLNVRKNKELIRKLVSYGKDIIVVSPVKLRNQIRKELQKALENY